MSAEDELELLQRGLAILDEGDVDRILGHLVALMAEVSGMASVGLAVIEADAHEVVSNAGAPAGVASADPEAPRCLRLLSGTGVFASSNPKLPGGSRLLAAVPYGGQAFYDVCDLPGWPEVDTGPLSRLRTLLVLPIESSYSRGMLLIGDESPGQANRALLTRLRSLRALLRDGLMRRDLVETTRREAEAQAARVEQERFLGALFERLPGIVHRVHNDPAWTVQFISEAVDRVLGYPASAFYEEGGPTLGQLVHPDDEQGVWDGVQAALDRGDTGYELVFRMSHRDGSIKWMWEQGRFVFDDGTDELLALEGFLQDITELKRVETDLAGERQLVEITLDAMSEAVARADADGRLAYVNPAFERLLGIPAVQLRGRAMDDAVRLRRESTGESISIVQNRAPADRGSEDFPDDVVLVSSDELEHPVEVTALRSVHGVEHEMLGFVLVLRDVRESRRAARRLQWQAHHDALTGVANRRAFEQRLQDLLEDAIESGRTHALLYLDLDNFKQVNDAAGHPAGDALLRKLTEGVQGQLRDQDVLARVGGDEFSVLLENHDRESARRVAERLHQFVRDWRFDWNGRWFDPGVSIGIALVTPEQKTSIETVLRQADEACFMAKNAGRNQVCGPLDPTMA